MLTLYWLLVALMVVGIIGAVITSSGNQRLVAIVIWGAVQGSFGRCASIPLLGDRSLVFRHWD